MKKVISFSFIFLLVASFISWGVSDDPVEGTDIGNVAPDISYPGPDGKVYKLSDLRGKIVLIDFWASWCGPCRRENPHVVKAYNEYKDQKFKGATKKTVKGFEIFSVSLDQNRERWIQAIEKDQLAWPYHVSDLKGWSSAPGVQYGVRSIPTNYLIDENGVIIAKNLRGPALEKKLKSLTK